MIRIICGLMLLCLVLPTRADDRLRDAYSWEAPDITFEVAEPWERPDETRIVRHCPSSGGDTSVRAVEPWEKPDKKVRLTTKQWEKVDRVICE